MPTYWETVQRIKRSMRTAKARREAHAEEFAGAFVADADRNESMRISYNAEARGQVPDIKARTGWQARKQAARARRIRVTGNGNSVQVSDGAINTFAAFSGEDSAGRAPDVSDISISTDVGFSGGGGGDFGGGGSSGEY